MEKQRPDNAGRRHVRIGILCAGNPLMGDEGVGIALVPLLQEAFREASDVEVVDVGTPGLRLIWALDCFTHVVLVDCARMGLLPGEYRVFRPDDVHSMKALTGFSAHEGDLFHVLNVAEQTLDHAVGIRILGIEPERIAPGCSLSACVAARLEEYVAAVRDIVREWRAGTKPEPDESAGPRP